MPLTDADKTRAKYHLGYMNTQTAPGISYGMSTPIQTLFLVDRALELISELSVDRIRQLLNVLDGIECRLVDAQDRLAAIQLGNLKLRMNEPDMLEHEYWRWGGRLADVLGVPFYAYSNRYKYGVGNIAGSIPVVS